MSVEPSFPHVESTLLAGLWKLTDESARPADGDDESVRAARERLREFRSAQRTERYVFEGEIARGGMGAVYRVLDTDLRRTLAMKVVRGSGRGPRTGSLDVDPVLLARFLEEAQVTGQLDHPGIVPLHEVGIDAEGRVYFTMRLVRGKHLGEVFQQCHGGEEGWTRERAIEALVKVCDTLAFAHQKGVVHRDLKPQNIMAGKFGEVYVMDWGVARVKGRPDHSAPDASGETLSPVRTGRGTGSGMETMAGSVFGTPSFMAPEQARGEIERIDARSDVYSVGAVLYELLARRAPYVTGSGNDSGAAVLMRVIAGPPEPILAVAPDAPRELAAISAKAMERDPSRRYADMRALAEDLRAWLAGRPVSALRFSTFARATRWCRRNPWVAASLAAVTLGGVFGSIRLAALGSELVRGAARDDAASKARMMETVNALYASEVTARVDRAHVQVTHDWASKAGAIPIPATFLTDLAERISAEGEGVLVKHYSDYPFRFRGESKLDDFGSRALRELRVDPSRAVESFEDLAGRPVLRYAVARRMAAACVDCHNAHPDSPKQDWKVGDVRGVLEVVRPLDQDMERSRAGVRATLAVVAAIVVGLAGLCAFMLVRHARRRPAA